MEVSPCSHALSTDVFAVVHDKSESTTFATAAAFTPVAAHVMAWHFDLLRLCIPDHLLTLQAQTIQQCDVGPVKPNMLCQRVY